MAVNLAVVQNYRNKVQADGKLLCLSVSTEKKKLGLRSGRQRNERVEDNSNSVM